MSEKKFQISGKKYSTSTQSPWVFKAMPGEWIVAELELANGKKLRKRLAFSSLASGEFSAMIAGLHLHGKHSTAGEGSSEGSGAFSDIDAQNQLTAQFPGKVRQILVKTGEAVKAQQCLLKVEAMKMEFEILAPAAGKIKKIFVTEQQGVHPGDLYLELEMQAESSE